MKSPEELMQEIEVLRERISKLSAASLHISGREFTSEDEEVLVLLAAQAATAIANARTHRDEHRATKPYDRTGDEISVDEIERIVN